MIPSRQSALIDEYVTHVISGKQNVDDYLAQRGNGVTERAAMLHVAHHIRSAEHPSLSRNARDAGLRLVISSAIAQRRLTYHPRAQDSTHPSTGLRQTIVALALIVALLGSTVGTAFAAEESLPGEILYPVKIAREQVTISLAPAEHEIAMRLWIAERRTHEIEELGAAGREIPGSVLDALQDATTTAAASISASADPETEIVQRLADVCSAQNQVLDQVAGLTPPHTLENLERARAASEHALSIAHRILRPATTPPQENGGYPVVPPGQQKKQEDPDWEVPPGLEDKDGLPPGQQRRNEVPPGQERISPGLEDKGGESPGQEKKDETSPDEEQIPPGLEDKGGEPPGQQDRDHSPPGQEDKDRGK